MPITRVVAQGIGPFDRLDLDLSDGHGEAHPGPHILAGVNGCGKSTALRAIAWILAGENSGFPEEGWQHFLTGHPMSFASVVIKQRESPPRSYARTDKVIPHLATKDAVDAVLRPLTPLWRKGDDQSWKITSATSVSSAGLSVVPCAAAYAASRSLQYLRAPDLNKVRRNHSEGSLAFESTVENEAVQAWLVGLFSKAAIAANRGLSSRTYERSLNRLQDVLKRIYGEDVQLDVELDPVVQPRVRIRGQMLNLSQIPDGVRTIVGWLADFMMRRELAPPGTTERVGEVLLIDEIDAHLHPRWQRQVLPALRDALPGVQIIITTHSPFVISSCRGARVHVLTLDEHGRASAKPPVDAPFGQSVNATLMDIFGVESRFDLETEKDLDEWNELKRKEAMGRLSGADRTRLKGLTANLEERSEELRSIVASLPKIPRAVINSLLQGSRATPKTRRVAKR
jgi:energy-coupling factor transporter ATP-binding protein EcfA2